MMDSSPVAQPSPETPATCSESCRYAAPMTGNYLDWIWCSHPGALNRVRQVGEDCPAHTPARVAADVT